ncbi:hypothetical protein DL96DRAFT_1196984 [Flagelloscypha sp. PMI_526]|nr:hypothetical protein DL96DRAFT_1196984 [Flagelloscypha sp. PMI_526]
MNFKDTSTPWNYLVLLVNLLLGISIAHAQVAPVLTETGVSAYPFDISQITLTSSRFLDNQGRTLTYLKYVNLDRLLYVYRNNHGLSTNGATANGGWDAPTFPFRSHWQGHALTAWAQCYAQLKDSECLSRAQTFTAELLKCQQNNAAKGYSTGYLSGFPESDFTALESGTLTSGNVPYYVMHKLLAGLLDVYRWTGDANSKTVLLALGGWVNTRTAKLSTTTMQSVLNTEHGGMSEVLTDMYFQFGDSTWLTVAKRFDHTAIMTPLANNQDSLNGLHANTQIPKWIGAAREFKATANSTYKSVASNAWNIATSAHSYAIGANSQAEHFRAANAVAGYLTNDTAEACNSYNMLKLTRELFVMSPTSTTYFDFYERTLYNHLLPQQNPGDSHGQVTYFTPLNPGGKRGVGPAWGGGTWSTDYDSFWCCQGTGVETNTKFQDSIYFYDSSSLIVNLFIPSKLTWTARSVTVTQTTTYPISDTTTLTVSGSGTWAMKIRIPSWTSGATITVNGASAGITVTTGTYATLSRTWASGDVVVVKLPMQLRAIKANDNAALAAVAYGPIILSGNYGNTALSVAPTLTFGGVSRTASTALGFTATANGAKVTLGPFYDAATINYVVYWTTNGVLPTTTVAAAAAASATPTA